MTELTSLGSVQELLSSRRQAFREQLRQGQLDLPSAGFLRHSARALGEAALALDTDASDSESEAGEMTITRTITTPSKDRYGDIVLPRGCEGSIARYMANPQVFFAHQSCGLPIAHTTSLQIFDNKIRATAKFNGATDESRAVWRLASAGLLPGTSIGFLPKRAVLLDGEDEDERPRKDEHGDRLVYFDGWLPLKFLEWELLEWSVVSVPANAECVEGLSKALRDGKIDDQPIPLSLSKSLAPYALKAKVWSPGFNPASVGYSGVLMLGEEELEYQEGALVRFGKHTFTDNDEERNPVDPEQPAPPSTYEPSLQTAPEPLVKEGSQPGAPAQPEDQPAQQPHNAKPDDYQELCQKLAELQDCVKAHHEDFKCHKDAREKCHRELIDHGEKCHKELLAAHKELADGVRELCQKMAPAPQLQSTDPEVVKLIEAMQRLLAQQKKVNDTIYRLTGSRA